MMPLPYPDDDFSTGHQDAAPPAEGTDDHLGRLVAARLSADRRTSRQRITVSVQNRVVILLGSVPSAELAHLAGDKAWDTPGVFDVCNALIWPHIYR